MPTRKWMATQVTALTGWAVAFVSANFHWTTTIVIALVTIVSQAAVGWLVPNNLTPGGVPVRAKRTRKRSGESGYAANAVVLVVAVLFLTAVAFHFFGFWGLLLLLLLLLLLV